MSSNTNIGNTPVNQGYVQLVHMGETGGIDGTLRTLYDGDGTASDLQIASNKVKISTELYIGSKTATEFIQDIVGSMFTTGSYTNITTTYDDTNGNIDLSSSGEVTLTGTETLSNKTLASPTLTGTAAGANLTLSGDLTVNGTTIAVDQTNLDVSDNIIGLNRGASSNINDSGLIIERGSTGDNAAIIWDEAVGRFKLGTTTATPSSTGSISVSTGTLVASLAGNATSASSATTANALSTAGTLTFTGDVVGGTTPTYTSGGNLSIAMAIQPNSVALSTDTTGNYVGTITASSGLSSTGATSGEGIAHSISVNAGQVGITSIYNSSLKIGTASDGQIIDFNTSDEIRLGSSTQATVKIKTDPLGSAQDEVIIGDGSYDVDFVVDGSGGSTIFKVDAGTGNTAVTGDLSVSGSFSPATVSASTSVRTPLIEFTDGDDAITIADGGAMTFAKGFAVTSGASSFGANVAIKNTGGTTLQLNTSTTDVDINGLLGRINFSAPDEFQGSDANLLAASIVAKATADFTSTSNKTDMIFELGVSETASEKFRIVSDGKIKIGGSYTLPSSDGSANQVLKTNGSGTVSFADASGVDTSGTPVAQEYARFTDSNTIEGRSYAGVRTDLGLNIGTNVQAQDDLLQDIADLSLSNPTQHGYVLAYNDATPGLELVEQSAGAVTALNNATANELVTVGSTTTELDAEANLTFDGSTLALTGDLNVGSGDFFVDDSAGNVGIGTDSPATKLHIQNGSTSYTWTPWGGTTAIFEGTGSGDSVVSIVAPNTGQSSVWFGDTDHQSLGRVRYEHTNNQMEFWTNGIERVAIDSSGNVGIGVTSPSAYLHTEGASNGTESYAKFSTGSAAGDQILTIKSSSSRNHMALQVNTGAGATDDLALNPDGGNVGIGTASPSAKLQVVGHTSISGVGNALRFDTTGSTQSNIIQTINDYETVIATNRGSAGFGVIGNSDIRLGFGTSYNAAQTKLYINGSSGNVGIGTTSPDAKLVIDGGGDADADAGDASEYSLLINQDNNDKGIAFGFNGADNKIGAAIIAKGSGYNSNNKTDLQFYVKGTTGTTAPALAMTIDAQRNLKFEDNGTNPSAAANTAFLFNDGGEMKVLDELGNTTTISPHNFYLIPGGASEDRAWGYYSEKDIVDDEGNVTATQKVNVDMMKLARLVEELTGEKLVYTEED